MTDFKPQKIRTEAQWFAAGNRERRARERRTGEDRRDMIRFDLEQGDRRQHDRRNNANTWQNNQLG